jgi:hypothetical protein
MKAFSLIITLLCTEAFASCKLSSKYRYYSLSSPITMLLEELDLLGQLEAISVFHPVKNKEIKKLAGGIFLRPQVFGVKSKKKRIVFFDQSLEMRKNLSKVEDLNIIEVFTRKLGAFESFEVSVENVQNFLENCEKPLVALRKKVKEIKSNLLKKKFSKTVLFYLGSFSTFKKDPDLLIVGDGFVEDLKSIAKLKTYPSPLEYVPWSSKIMKSMPKNSLHIAVSDSIDKGKFLRVEKDKYNLKFRGALSPGIRQVYFIEYLLGLDI